MSQPSQPTPGSFGLIKLLVIVAAFTLVIGILIPAQHPHHGGRQLKCASQVRGIHQGTLLFAQNNQGSTQSPESHP